MSADSDLRLSFERPGATTLTLIHLDPGIAGGDSYLNFSFCDLENFTVSKFQSFLPRFSALVWSELDVRERCLGKSCEACMGQNAI